MNLHLGDCLEVLRTLPDASVHAVVTDPPYGLSFMGKRWDYDVPSVDIWAECLRVLKPGGHLLAFAGTRTQHRMAVRIEDAGFEIRDMIAWVYGSGFPKSLDVSKAIDRAAGAERELVGRCKRTGKQAGTYGAMAGNNLITAPATEAARQWQGWGTALKPALEPITVARKPLAGTVAENVLSHGTGALNIDASRVGTTRRVPASHSTSASVIGAVGRSGKRLASELNPNIGRWPANLIHDGSDEVLAGFPAARSGGHVATSQRTEDRSQVYGKYATSRAIPGVNTYSDTGSAARFFYTSKASREDRDHNNNHPTVKPTDLMRYLCRLVTPPGGTVLDPFMGSGSTGKAALLEGFDFIGIERDPAYHAIAQRRISRAAAAGHQPSLLEGVP